MFLFRGITIQVFLCIMLFSISCSNRIRYESIEDLKNKRIGVTHVISLEDEVALKLDYAKITIFNTTEDAIKALRHKKIEALIEDRFILENLSKDNENVSLLSVLFQNYKYGLAVKHDDNGFRASIDQTINLLFQTGILREMCDKWIYNKEEVKNVSNFELVNKNGVLIFGTSSTRAPFSYKDESGKIIGLDIELAHFIAQGLEMDLKIIDMQFSALIPSVIAGRVDFIGAGIYITDSRRKSVSFSKPFLDGGIGILVRK